MRFGLPTCCIASRRAVPSSAVALLQRVEASREGWCAVCPLQRFRGRRSLGEGGNHLTILSRRSHFFGTWSFVSGIDPSERPGNEFPNDERSRKAKTRKKN